VFFVVVQKLFHSLPDEPTHPETQSGLPLAPSGPGGTASPGMAMTPLPPPSGGRSSGGSHES
jgi:hypothetical protein